MKPQRFEIGQAVAFKFIGLAGERCEPISLGKIYHINGYHWDSFCKEWYCFLKEMPQDQVAREADLEPVITDSELIKELEQITEPVEI